MFCCTLLYVHSSIAIILMGKRELIALHNLSSWCLVMVERLFLAVPQACLQFVIVVFPDHTHLLFFTCSKYKPGRAISACLPNKILKDLTQKPTKLIRTELVKMTSEASLLPTDLKNIHQTVLQCTEAGERPKSRRELHECL